MKLWAISDMHLEMQEPLDLPIPAADVCVLAGDIHSPLARSVQWAHMHIGRFMPVILVAGNHEFYRDSIAGGLALGHTTAVGFPDVHLLHARSVVIDDVRFIGATLWTDYALHAEHRPGERRDQEIAFSMREADSSLNDHRAIHVDESYERRWTPAAARRQHLVERAFIERTLDEEHLGPTVVVTHHAPHPGSIARQYAGSSVNACFASDLSDTILNHRPELWIHGHMHNSSDYRVGETRIIANPRGYGRENDSFDRALIVEV